MNALLSGPRPRALDLFCGAGGASMGLYRAGFDVYGVDHRPQPRYPFWFLKADWSDVDLSGFDLIWASPPCQKFSSATPARCRPRHLNLIPAVRDELAKVGRPYVIENVPLAPLRADLVLTGDMFGLAVIRRRHFETNLEDLVAPGPVSSGYGRIARGEAVTVAGGGGADKGNLARWSEAMGIDWMSRREVVQAVPPAYAECIGRQAMNAIDVSAGRSWPAEFRPGGVDCAARDFGAVSRTGSPAPFCLTAQKQMQSRREAAEPSGDSRSSIERQAITVIDVAGIAGTGMDGPGIIEGDAGQGSASS